MGRIALALTLPLLPARGTTTLDLRLFATAGDTFATSTTRLTGTITYDSTPVTVPESGSLSLFGVGLDSLLRSMRLRATRER
jgi:hypothetical protein